MILDASWLRVGINIHISGTLRETQSYIQTPILVFNLEEFHRNHPAIVHQISTKMSKKLSDFGKSHGLFVHHISKPKGVQQLVQEGPEIDTRHQAK